MIGAPLAAGLLYMDGLGHLRGWQWLFIIEGCLTVIYGVILKVSAQITGCVFLLDTAAGP